LLPVKYYHVVFLPHELTSSLAIVNFIQLPLCFCPNTPELCKRQAIHRRNTRYYKCITYLGAAAKLSSACTLHCKWRRHYTGQWF
jgi:hypothetical protein